MSDETTGTVTTDTPVDTTTTDATTQAAATTTQETTTQDTTATTETTAVDWRKELAGDDDKELKFLQRYATKQDYHKANIEARKKISAGELAKPLPKDATPEQVSEWRKANGIPEKPDQYFEKLPNGRVIGAEDKPIFDALANRLHGKNVQPEVMHDIVDFYYSEIVDKETAALAETDKRESTEYEDAMRKAWGDDYRPNLNHLSNWMEGLPEGVKKAFDGFGADGRKLKNNPEVMQWLGGLAREFNPAGFVTPGGNENMMQSIDSELAKLTAMSGKSTSEYWKGPMAEKHQARMRELLDAKDKLSKRV